MKSIEEYIEMSKYMENTSDGGSVAYHFDDVVLIKYVMPSEYGIARIHEEEIAKCANELNEKGVKTPKHIALKRQRDDKLDICWVLQQRAPGICFSNYCLYVSNPEIAQKQLIMQEKVLNIPDSHYQKCILDLIELSDLGIELKPKNVYYDELDGFTFIDLLGIDRYLKDKPLERNYWLLDLPSFIYGHTVIPSYIDNASEEQKNKSNTIKKNIKKKVLINMEKVIPEFYKYKRWILRESSLEELNYFNSNGYPIDDLSLNEEEYTLFNNLIEQMINDLIKKLSTGECEYWQIEINEIKNSLKGLKLLDAWRYHKDNKKNIEDFESEYYYRYECEQEINKIVNDKFNKKLASIESNNEFIIKAQQDMQEELEEQRRRNI